MGDRLVDVNELPDERNLLRQSVSMGLYDGRNCGYDERGRKYCLIKLLFMRLE